MSRPAGDDAHARGTGSRPRLSRGWRWALYLGLAAVMALGFRGYLSPAMMLSWETLVALCGF